MKKYTNRGFTLIELLVVIAIIGILSSVVLASLNTARNKGGDTAIKANLATLRVQSEFYYEANNSSYGTAATSTIVAADGTCTNNSGIFTDTTIKNALKSAMVQAGAGNAYCGAAGTNWAVSIPLKSNPGQSWCVGNVGKAGPITTPASATAFLGC